ncbi:hypothetical protein IWQ62_000313 [Dispira parvispora]|uniref:Mediator of RNA polymerase II transcription subunit 4 n=1 Tax=Dispira parvispora TaxID=1520584 RepID=A0A9W8E557_9FUNG|nr:hypothetical protein IWQ62_000313 [Dispira parvispora]
MSTFPPQVTQSKGLADNVPLRDKLLSLLTEFRQCIRLLFNATQRTCQELLPDSSTASSHPLVITQRLVRLDESLRTLLAEVAYHQRLQARIIDTRQATQSVNQQVLGLVQRLMETKATLETFIRNAEERVHAIDEAERNLVTLDDVVPYANRLSNYTAAPPNFDPKLQNMPTETPYPAETTMRAGLFNQKRNVTDKVVEEAKEEKAELDVDAELMSSFMAHHEHDQGEFVDLLDLDLNPDL